MEEPQILHLQHSAGVQELMLVLSMQALTQHYIRWEPAGTPGSRMSVSVGQQGRGYAWAWTLTQLGGHRAQVAGTSQDLPSCFSPAWCPGMGGDRRGREERRDLPVGSGLGSVLSMAQSWALCHVHTPTRPSGLGKCFASGVTVVP